MNLNGCYKDAFRAEIGQDFTPDTTNSRCVLKFFGAINLCMVSQIIAANSNIRGGKSELHRAMPGVTPLYRKIRNSGTERMSRASILSSGTGEFRGAAGVKTAKLGVKQDQIGEQGLKYSLRAARLKFPGQIA